MTREEVQQLALELPRLTLHGPVPTETVMALASEVALLLRERGIRGALEDVNRFHQAVPDDILQEIGDRDPALTRRSSRWKMLKEEVDELEQAIMENDLHGVADAYADIIYIVLGSALMHLGKERFARVWDEVQRSNMDKVSESGMIKLRGDGKVLKPDGWRGPDIELAFRVPAKGGTGA